MAHSVTSWDIILAKPEEPVHYKDVLTPALPPQVQGNAMVWQHPTRKGVKIRLEGNVAALLAESSLRALAAANQRETGGLLLGFGTSSDAGLSIVITGAEFVASEGRLYHATPRDEAALVACCSGPWHPGDPAAIGYFRTDLENRSSLTDREKRFVKGHLPSYTSVSILLRPLNPGICLARVFLWENDHLEGNFSGFEIPFFGSEGGGRNRRQAAIKADDEPAVAVAAITQSPIATIPKPAAPPAAKALAGSEPQTNRVAVKPDWKLGALKAVTAFCVGGMLAVGILYFYLTWRSKPGNATAQLHPPANLGTGRDLGMRVDRPARGQLDISWDRNLLANAIGAQLEIVDDSRHRTLSLDREQLRLGKLTYFPSGAQISFRLNVAVMDESPWTEYMVVLAFDGSAAGRPGTTVHELAVQTLRKASPGNAEAASPGLPEAASLAEKPSVEPALVSTEPVDAGHPAESASVRQPEAGTAPPAEGPPQVAEGGASSAQTALKDNNSEPTSPGKQTVPEESTAPRPLATDAPGKAVPIQARPRIQVKPEIPQWVPRTDLLHTHVAVEVSVDESGNVAGARVTSANSLLLTAACIQAAKRWKFLPATVNGQAVGSTYVITFAFQPTPQ